MQGCQVYLIPATDTILIMYIISEDLAKVGQTQTVPTNRPSDAGMSCIP